MQIQTDKLTPAALANKAAEGKRNYIHFVSPIDIKLLTGHEGQNVKLYYQPYWDKDPEGNPTTPGERELLPTADVEKATQLDLFGGARETLGIRDLWQYEAEELRLSDRHHIPEIHIENILTALEVVLANAIGHLEVLGIAAGAALVETTLSIEYWLDERALARVMDIEDRLDYRDLIRISTRHIKYIYDHDRVLA